MSLWSVGVGSDARAVVELAARNSYGTLVAWLASRCQDLALAEDAMGDALEAALSQWPVDGVPDNPEAWLLTAARRRMIDRRRRATTRITAAQRLRLEVTEWAESPFTPALPDRRLALMLACVHEQIDPATRVPLMLQAVLGLDARAIAGAFMVKPATMAQRLVRAKRRIRQRLRRNPLEPGGRHPDTRGQPAEQRLRRVRWEQ